MNIDLNTAAFQAYQLAQQLVTHYTSYGAQSEPVAVYAKNFYEYLTSDTSYDFDTLSQSLQTVVGRHCAQMSAQYCQHNDNNNAKILKAAKSMESAMRSSGAYYSASRMSINLDHFAVNCVSPQNIVRECLNELEQYAEFVKMALSNTWEVPPTPIPVHNNMSAQDLQKIIEVEILKAQAEREMLINKMVETKSKSDTSHQDVDLEKHNVPLSNKSRKL